MIKSFVALADPGRTHVGPWHRAAWFVLGSLQREHALNMRALFATSPSAIFGVWMTVLHAAAGLHPELIERRIDGRRGPAGPSTGRGRTEPAGNR
jgi:hypothetical protein